MKTALYDLARRPAGFDFFPWLICQHALGARRVHFDARRPKTDKWPADAVQRRIASILVPGPALLGMSRTISLDAPPPAGAIELTSGSQRDLVDRVNGGLKIPRLRSVLPPNPVARYTVTLRTTQRIPVRNSDEQLWRDFAREIGALVIEDYDVKPIGLHERMAIYAGAEMNMTVTNGPVMLCFLSEYPAMSFDVGMSPMTKLGISVGESYPFLLPDRHFQFYEPVTAESVRQRFYQWRDGK